MTPIKISYRDLSPELKRMLAGQGIPDEALKALLQDYRKKDENIRENDIELKYRDRIDGRFDEVNDKIDKHILDYEELPLDVLTPELKTRLESLEKAAKYEDDNIKSLQGVLDKLEEKIRSLQTIQENIINSGGGGGTSADEVSGSIVLLDESIKDIKKRIEDLKETLLTKRDTNVPITRSDLDDTIASMLNTLDENNQRIEEKIQQIDKIVEQINGSEPGNFIGVDDEGAISTKELSMTLPIAYTMNDLNSYSNDATANNVLVYSEGQMFKKLKDGETPAAETLEKYPNIPKGWDIDKEYFLNNQTELNTIIYDRKKKHAVGITRSDGVIRFVLDYKTGFSITLDVDEKKVVPRSNTSSRETPIIYIKTVDEDGNEAYLDSDFYVSVIYGESSYTLENFSGEKLELLLLE